MDDYRPRYPSAPMSVSSGFRARPSFAPSQTSRQSSRLRAHEVFLDERHELGVVVSFDLFPRSARRRIREEVANVFSQAFGLNVCPSRAGIERAAKMIEEEAHEVSFLARQLPSRHIALGVE